MEDQIYLERLGERIAKLRKKQKLTQAQLAEKVDGLYTTDIGRAERAEVNSTIIMLRKIAKGLGISIEELVNIK